MEYDRRQALSQQDGYWAAQSFVGGAVVAPRFAAERPGSPLAVRCGQAGFPVPESFPDVWPGVGLLAPGTLAPSDARRRAVIVRVYLEYPSPFTWEFLQPV